MDWTDEDEQDWQSLLASEPAQATKRRSQGEDEMINVVRRQLPINDSTTPKGITFLKPSHLTKEGKVLTIYKVTNSLENKSDKPDAFGNPIVVFYKMDGQKYSKGYKLTSDLLAAHVDVLGEDETKWIKKSILGFQTKGDEGDIRCGFGPVSK